MGDPFGKQQSGEAMFRIADPVRDEVLNDRAREVASGLLERNPELKSVQGIPIRKVLSERYSRALERFRSG